MAESIRQVRLDNARGGDREALGALLDHFRPYIRVLVHSAWRKQASPRQDDSDLIQDTMLVAQQAFDAFRGATVAEFARWLRTLALRTVGHAIRSQVMTGKRGIRREAVVADLQQLAASDDQGPERDLERHELAARVAAALERLPSDMQSVLRARAYDDLPYAELALQMQRSEGALRVLYTRALARLGDELIDE